MAGSGSNDGEPLEVVLEAPPCEPAPPAYNPASDWAAFEAWALKRMSLGVFGPRVVRCVLLLLDVLMAASLVAGASEANASSANNRLHAIFLACGTIGCLFSSVVSATLAIFPGLHVRHVMGVGVLDLALQTALPAAGSGALALLPLEAGDRAALLNLGLLALTTLASMCHGACVAMGLVLGIAPR
jgi:hypothetical protein